MQDIAPVTTSQFLAAGQEPLLKLEIFIDPNWINICDLGGKNYLKSISMSFAGAEMSPLPIAAKFKANINNEDAIFHPKHPTSAYVDYFKAGRQVRISVGAKYGGVDYYWQRIIGYMDIPKFSGATFKITISGLDYMKVLTDTKLWKLDNYWGSDVTKATFASEETLGAEIYDEDDAMEIIADANNVTPWDVPLGATISSQAPGGAPSTNVGRITKIVPGFPVGYVEDNNVGTVEQGKEYKAVFQYKRNAVTAGELSVGIYKTATTWAGTTVKNLGDTVEPTIPNTNGYFYECTAAGTTAGGEPAWPTPEGTGVVDGTVTWGTRHMDDKKMGEITPLTANVWTEEAFYFTATESSAIKMRLTVRGIVAVATEFDVDVFSIKEVTGSSNAGYNLPNDSNGVYYVTLDGVPIYYRDEGQGWYYESETKRIFIENGRVLVDDQSLRVYYFTTQIPENVVADLLVTGGLYVNQVAALVAMDFDATGVTIDKVWFEAGKSALDAIKMLCERCDYRFYFKYDHTPVFKPFPTAKAEGFEDMQFRRWHIDNPEYYEDRNEIRNRIVIEGLKQAQLVAPEDTTPSELNGEAHDDVSIAAYGESTLPIKNHLFQDQDSIDDMCDTLLARYKDPKWYFDFGTPFNPAPLEIWDTIRGELLLKASAIAGYVYDEAEYDEGEYGSEEIAVLIRALIRDIKIDSHNITYKCEEVT